MSTHLPDADTKSKRKVSEMCEAMLKKNVIKIGDYGTLIEVVSKVNVPLADEIKDLADKIQEVLKLSTEPDDDASGNACLFV